MISITLKLFAISQIINYRQNVHNKLVFRQIPDKTYDYIVVGAGSAGCVVAARLAENAFHNVLLLEAGGPQTTTSDIPAMWTASTDLDWNYPIVPQKNAYFARINNQWNIPRGRVFGGSSVLNGMNYYRESEQYFDLWQSQFGIKNWTFNQNLKYFLRSENNLDPKIVRQSPGYHRTGGELAVSTITPDIMLDRYSKSAQMLGHPQTYTDGRQPFGVTILQKTIKDGIRQSSATAFLESNLKINLHTIGNSIVTKILFDEKKRAIGVNFNRNGLTYTVKARKEVIISAGVIGSPQLLMLSGIGPEEHLKSLKIPVISNLRVGDNMQQSVALSLYYDIKNQSEIEKPISNIDNQYDYFVKHTGPLAYSGSGMHCFKEIVFKNASNGCNLPGVVLVSDDLEAMVSNFKLKDQWKDYFRPYLNRSAFILLSLVRRPKSIGTIRLVSDNPFDYPLIDPCIFCNQTDIDELVKTTKLALNVFESSYFKQFVEIYKNPVPGCNPCPDQYFCDSYLRCVAQTNTFYFVPVGTCRIGSVGDENAVVDERLRVKGVSRLRVIDSSAVPLPGEHMSAISLMVGEKGAQFVKDDAI